MKQLWKQVIISLLALSLASALCLFLYQNDNKYTAPGAQPIAGMLFVSEQDWSTVPIRYLWNGWTLYPDTLLTPESYSNRDQSTMLPVQIGSYNNFSMGNKARPAHGSGTYVLTLMLPETPHTYALELPEIFSAYRLYGNDKLLLEMGNPDPDAYTDRVQNRMVSFEASGTFRLLLAVSDYSHFYSGMVYPPAFGEPLALNTARGIRVCLSVAAMTTVLLIALLALFLSFKTYRKRQSAWIFFLLGITTAVFISYPMVHGILPLAIQPWYTIELVSGYLVTLFIVLTHNRLCKIPKTVSLASGFSIGFCCLLALGYSVCSASLTSSTVTAFSHADFVFKILTTGYLLTTALISIRHREKSVEPVFYVDIFYAAVFAWDCLLPAYEPIVGGWFQEWGAIIIAAALGMILWMDVVNGYRRSLTFSEEQRQMQRQLFMQQEHHRQLSEKIEDSRRQRHDFRQHLRTIANLADNKADLLSYISQITVIGEQNRLMAYSHNPALDALIHYYASAAENAGIRMEILVDLPQELSLPDVAFCTIIGNLMENALEACKLQTSGDRRILLNCKWQFEKVYLVLENTYEGELCQRHGVFLSRKHEGVGIGIESVKEQVELLRGTVKFQSDGGVFQVVLTLPL